MRRVVLCLVGLLIIIFNVGCKQRPIAQEMNIFDIKMDEAAVVEDYFYNSAQISFGTAVQLSKLKDIYPVHFFILRGSYLISEFENEKSLKKLISEEYYWTGITETNQVVKIRNVNGTYNLSSVRVSPPTTGYDYIVDKDAVIAEVANSDIKKIDEVFIVTDELHALTIVVIESDSDEYVVPFCARPDFSHLENGKLYTAEEAIQILKEWYCAS